ncbi:hypothetical protein SEA_LYMARA_93 [Arthrobacter phage Lymara]|uniref:Uncharacterized protein n=1 Tax=Arthrobacter phage Lymara TaxID=2599828 RepID=A0A5J6TXX1_9CAUD|nr:hypothetical protein HYQ01_gp093 [Arthrobacter phage Lymara]QFG14894.1 hypothetical protein SEA_LYMARA_93 [Arthrobacter phage Lymara]
MSDHIAAIRADLERERLALLQQVSTERHTPTYYRHRPERPSVGRRRAELLRTENAAFYAARKATK